MSGRYISVINVKIKIKIKVGVGIALVTRLMVGKRGVRVDAEYGCPLALPAG